MDYEAFSKDPIRTINNQNLMFKCGDYIYPRDEGLTLLVSKVVFGKNFGFG